MKSIVKYGLIGLTCMVLISTHLRAADAKINQVISFTEQLSSLTGLDTNELLDVLCDLREENPSAFALLGHMVQSESEDEGPEHVAAFFRETLGIEESDELTEQFGLLGSTIAALQDKFEDAHRDLLGAQGESRTLDIEKLEEYQEFLAAQQAKKGSWTSWIPRPSFSKVVLPAVCIVALLWFVRQGLMGRNQLTLMQALEQVNALDRTLSDGLATMRDDLDGANARLGEAATSLTEAQRTLRHSRESAKKHRRELKPLLEHGASHAKDAIRVTKQLRDGKKPGFFGKIFGRDLPGGATNEGEAAGGTRSFAHHPDYPYESDDGTWHFDDVATHSDSGDGATGASGIAAPAPAADEGAESGSDSWWSTSSDAAGVGGVATTDAASVGGDAASEPEGAVWF